MTAAERERGRRAEVAVVNYLRAQGWPDTRRYLAGDGRQPGDIDWHPLICLEVKDRAKSSWPSWCRQAAAEARRGLVPAVVRRTRGTPDVGLWECRFDFQLWCEITDDPTIAKPPSVETWGSLPFAALVAGVRGIDAEADR